MLHLFDVALFFTYLCLLHFLMKCNKLWFVIMKKYFEIFFIFTVMIVIIILFQRDLIQSLVEYVAFHHKMPRKKRFSPWRRTKIGLSPDRKTKKINTPLPRYRFESGLNCITGRISYKNYSYLPSEPSLEMFHILCRAISTLWSRLQMSRSDVGVAYYQFDVNFPQLQWEICTTSALRTVSGNFYLSRWP